VSAGRRSCCGLEVATHHGGWEAWLRKRPTINVDQGEFSAGGLAADGTDKDSNRVTASTMAPVWLGFDAARNLAFLKGW
jgi:hypothetical protein